MEALITLLANLLLLSLIFLTLSLIFLTLIALWGFVFWLIVRLIVEFVEEYKIIKRCKE